MTPKNRIFALQFAEVYSLYVQKAERKDRTQDEVDQIICWLTGYDQAGLRQQIEQKNDFETFFAQAPVIHPNSALIKGVVCGVRVGEVYMALTGWPSASNHTNDTILPDVYLETVMPQAAVRLGDGPNSSTFPGRHPLLKPQFQPRWIHYPTTTLAIVLIL